MDGLWLAGLFGVVAAALLIAEHYLLWHWRGTLRRYPPAAYSIGLGTLFAVWAVWAATQPAQPPLVTVAGCAIIAGIGGVADVAVWWWHPRQDAADAAGVAAVVEGTEE